MLPLMSHFNYSPYSEYDILAASAWLIIDKREVFDKPPEYNTICNINIVR